MIEQLNLQNIEEILQLEEDCFPLPWKKELLLSHLENYYASGVRQPDELPGYIWFRETDMVEILRIGVSRSNRRTGIALKLVEELKDFDKNIILEVSDNNTSALAFYKKAGFTESGTRENYYADGSNAILLDLALTE